MWGDKKIKGTKLTPHNIQGVINDIQKKGEKEGLCQEEIDTITQAVLNEMSFSGNLSDYRGIYKP